MKITIVDPKQRLIDVVNSYFSNTEEVTAVVGDFRSYDADALVSPANSFGIMDGGIDALYTEYLGRGIQKNYRDCSKICVNRGKYFKELFQTKI